MIDLVEVSRLYQVALEAVRVEPDAEDLQRTLTQARRELEIAWLRNAPVLG